MKNKYLKTITILFIIILLLGISNKVNSADIQINVENAHKAIKEVSDAYYSRGTNIQYCTYRKSFIASPEEATVQHTNYTVCSNYIYSVYYQAFGIKLPHVTSAIIAYGKEYYNSDNIEKNDVLEYWEKTENRYLCR